ncbi:MAG: M15 family metallopeptidase [Prevotellaceae bacterium]|jgi:peptidoglycan L-alanyl-D-glutamate endopeptidase CwlK|nr:M15 family metallopeptidase [Prevotellaceae bacterium]
MGNLLHKERLEGVNESLVDITEKAVEQLNFDVTVSEGLRTIETQQKYVAEGKSKTMYSKHITGYAVDLYPIVNGSIDNTKFEQLAAEMKKQAALQCAIIEWGGDWKTFIDKPHFQLNQKKNGL